MGQMRALVSTSAARTGGGGPGFDKLGPNGLGLGLGWEWEWEWEVKWPGCRTVLYTPAPFALSLSKGCAGGAPWL